MKCVHHVPGQVFTISPAQTKLPHSTYNLSVRMALAIVCSCMLDVPS